MGLGDENYSGTGDPAAPAGWYPVDGGLQRYWDGQAWTEHTAPAPAPAPGPSPAPGPQPEDAPAPWVDGAPLGQTSDSDIPLAQPLARAAESQPIAWSAPGQSGAPLAVPAPTAVPTSDDKSMAMLAHLLTLVAGFLGPLIIWLVKRDQSPFVDHHGKEALNFQISMFVYWIGALFAMLVLIGFLLIPVLIVFQFLFPILGAVSANRGDLYRYPMTIRFIN